MEGFERVEYPPKLPDTLDISTNKNKEKRETKEPISLEYFQQFIDDEGRITDEYILRKNIFKKGICYTARKEVWPFLFGLYQFNSTKRMESVHNIILKSACKECIYSAICGERMVIMTDHCTKYVALQKRWKKLLEEDSQIPDKVISPSYLKDVPECQCQPSTFDPELKQQEEFLNIQAQVYSGRSEIDTTTLIPAIKVIDKDVPRTDRTTAYFGGPGNVHLRLLRRILITYAAYHPQVGYAQGMNDIVARFLRVLDDEVSAYWCLVNYLQHMQADFTEEGMLTKLVLVRQLLCELDLDLLTYLDQLDVGDLTFCHRWMLLSFKREFNEEDGNRCFEILSCRHLELSSHEAEVATQREKMQDFSHKEGNQRVVEPPSNIAFTFEVFMCATILMHYRDDLFKCAENSDVFSLVASLTMNLNLQEILERTETLFYGYCKKSVITDCFQLIELPSPDESTDS